MASQSVRSDTVHKFEVRPVDEVNPDVIEVRFTFENDDVQYVLFDGINSYPNGIDAGITKIPRSEDFLQQFAAYLGYRVVKD
jgi:hypothetical protein